MKAADSSDKFIDPRVFITMALAAFISVIIVGFKVYQYEPCPEIEISFKPGTPRVGEIIQFKAVSNGGMPSEIQWDFGTIENSTKSGSVVNYTFDQPGRYEVNLSADKACGTYTTIYIQEAPVFIDKKLLPEFSGPQTAEVGTPVTFKDQTENAQKWEWWFGENNYVDATTREAIYIFKTVGEKRIQLVVDGNKIGEQMIEIVSAKPRQTTSRKKQQRQEPTIAVPRRPIDRPIQESLEGVSSKQLAFPEITVQEMESKLKGVVDGNGSVEDLYMYLCEGESLQITYNGTLMSLSDLNGELVEIRKGRKIKDLEVNINKDPTSNCINSMSINLKKKRIILFGD